MTRQQEPVLGPAQPQAARPSAARRLWLCARLLPTSALLLGSRYQALFLAHARQTAPQGPDAEAADALAFARFSLRQHRVALLPAELSALRRDARRLERRYVLRRQGGAVRAEKKGWARRCLGL